MIEVLKGFYPWFAWLAILGCAARIRSRAWTRLDSALAAAFLCFALSILLQSWLFYGTLQVSRRYLLIGVPLYFPWAAHGIIFLKELLPRRGAAKIILPFLLAGIIIFLLRDASSPLIRERASGSKGRERAICLAVSEFIRNDWRGPRFLERSWQKCDQYQNGKRPLVRSSFGKLGYLCGGQNHTPEFAAAGLPPDYVVSFLEPPPGDGFKLRGKVFFRREAIYIYQREHAYEH